jgi:hypothetical protein
VVEHLPSKHLALSSNPNTSKKSHGGEQSCNSFIRNWPITRRKKEKKGKNAEGQN